MCMSEKRLFKWLRDPERRNQLMNEWTKERKERRKTRMSVTIMIVIIVDALICTMERLAFV